MDVCLAMVTFPDRDTARKVTRILVEEQLAACGNLVGDVESIYRWKGAVEEASEVLALFKTTVHRFSDFAARVRALHPYEVPEILQLPIQTGSPDYLAWIRASVE